MTLQIQDGILRNAVVLIPAHNESEQIKKTITDLKNYFSNIVVVDDGSTDHTYEVISNLNVVSGRHPINLGQGATIQTALSLALIHFKNCQYFITFDADGQHSVNSALEMLQLIHENDYDIVLGSRFINKNPINQIPQKKRLILKLGILFTKLDTGLKITDTHNGLRVMKRNFAESLSLRQNGMAHASEILAFIQKSNARWIEAPAEIYYTEYSIKKGQSILNAINILTEMMHK